MSDVTVRVDGAKELRRKLKKMGGDLKDMKAIHREASELVADEARRRAPYRDGAITSGIRAGATQTKAVVRSGTVGRSKEYAARQHWSQQKGQAGFEYVYRAVGKLGRDVVDLYHDRVDDLVDRMNRSGKAGTF